MLLLVQVPALGLRFPGLVIPKDQESRTVRTALQRHLSSNNSRPCNQIVMAVQGIPVQMVLQINIIPHNINKINLRPLKDGQDLAIHHQDLAVHRLPDLSYI